jgi:hypothetical protein
MAVKVLKFSRHFVAQWAERVGGFPCIEGVNEILGRGMRIIKQERLFRRHNDGTMVSHKELSHFWCHADGMILLIDELNGIAVTVLTPDMASKFGCTAEARRRGERA